MRIFAAVSLCIALVAAPLSAQGAEEPDVMVTPTMELPADAEWKHSFDAYEGEKGVENVSLGRAAAFYRIMEQAGVDPARVEVAVVIHGPAIFDVVKDTRYAREYGEGERNQTYNTVAELVAKGAQIWVCGVSARYRKVGDDDLLEGVRMAPAAMVAHAELQRRGFSLNPY